MKNNELSKVSIEELSKKLSYLDLRDLGDRAIYLSSYFNQDEEWEMWLPNGEGEILRLKGEPVEGTYFAREAVKDTDVFFEFFNFVEKRASFPGVSGYVAGILEDVYNLAASLDKIELFYKIHKQEKVNTYRRYISTEMEYIFAVCRSIFDLLQKVVLTLWRRIRLFDSSTEKRNLPDSFAKMVLKGNTLLSEAEIEATYGIPSAVANFYFSQGKFFQWLRDYRDKIGHHGKGIEFIFFSEQGVAISIDREPFSTLNIWNEKNTLPNSLGSLKSAVSHVVVNTLGALEDFAQIIQGSIQFPGDIAPNCKVFLRSDFSYRLIGLDRWIYDEPWTI